ncbi:unnamed protein product [Rhodiola kirilowii]
MLALTVSSRSLLLCLALSAALLYPSSAEKECGLISSIFSRILLSCRFHHEVLLLYHISSVLEFEVDVVKQQQRC